MKHFYYALFVCITLHSIDVYAKSCVKGKSCGNTCISKDKVCWKGRKLKSSYSAPTLKSWSSYDQHLYRQAQFGCSTSWTATEDVILYKKDKEAVLDDYAYKLKVRALQNNQTITDELIAEIRRLTGEGLDKIIADVQSVEEIRNDPELVRSAFMPYCIKSTMDTMREQLKK